MQKHPHPINNEEFIKAQSERHTTLHHEYPDSPWYEEVWGEFWQYIKEPHLDVGARDGQLLRSLEERGIKNAIGLEITDLADHAMSLERNVVKGDIQRTTLFDNKQFKSVTMLHTLEHLYDPDAALEEIKRILDGHILIIVPAQPADKGIDYKFAHFTQFDSHYDVANLLWLHGFEIIKGYEKGPYVHCVIAKTT